MFAVDAFAIEMLDDLDGKLSCGRTPA